MDNSVRENTGRPCKACFSWEEMLKFTKRHKDDNSNKDKSELNNENKIQEIKGSWSSRRKQQQILKHRRKDCPLDKDQLGRSTWNLLHTFSIYPCEHCAADFRLDLKENPPILTNRTLFAQWMCEAHNRVNSKLGKSLFDCNKVMERWYDGWSDGSCDP